MGIDHIAYLAPVCVVPSQWPQVGQRASQSHHNLVDSLQQEAGAGETGGDGGGKGNGEG